VSPRVYAINLLRNSYIHSIWSAYQNQSSARTIPSEALNGKRSISKEQAKKLASLFKVTVDLFI